MSEYTAPSKDMRFVIRELAGLDRVLAAPRFESLDIETIEQVIEEAGHFAADVLAPLNITGDREACRVEDREVAIADGFVDAYRQFVANGWQSIAAPPEYDGMGLPDAVAIAAFEMWQSANMSFSLCPMLTTGAINAIETHGTEALRGKFLPKLVSGEWSGTMVLTEPQAGSDLAALTTRAIAEGDHYRVTGTKIYITWGDHPMAENIIHLVLARLVGAPDGVRGISMFLVPKYLVNDDGSLGSRNDVYATSVEHKMGIHASPTCVLNFGDSEGAIGYLVGQENRGLSCMFTMMNRARLEVGVQGIAISERAYQLARAYAMERVQGNAPGHKDRVTIIHHADVRRMLLVMKAQVEAMRAAAYAAGALLDVSAHAADDDERRAADARLALLTPVVKGWPTEVAQEVTSLGIQIHGGMGFVEETGAAQHYRDARILPIYEGTTGIQAIDFVGRKVLGDEGMAIRSLIADMQTTVSAMEHGDLQDMRNDLADGIDVLNSGVEWLLANAARDPNLPGTAAVNLLMMTGTVLGAWQMARAATSILRGDGDYDASFRSAKLITARFYLEHILPRARAYMQAAIAGPESVMAMTEEQF